MKRIASVILMFLLSFCFISCGIRDSVRDSDKFYIYFKEAKTKNLYPVETNLDLNDDSDEVYEAIFTELWNGPASNKYISPVPENLELKNITKDGEDLIFDFSPEYYELPGVDEILLRASLVKTFTQLQNVHTVEIHVDGQPLILGDGSVVKPQKSGDFVDLFGSGLNAFNEAELTLYYPVVTGDRLKKTTRTVNYRVSQSPELIAVKKILSGPDGEEGLVSPFTGEVGLLSVNTKNGVCTVNLEMKDNVGSIVVLPDVIAYSLVDTLTELNGISSVQILVNGVSDDLFLDAVDISKPLYRDLDYVSDDKETEENITETEMQDNDE